MATSLSLGALGASFSIKVLLMLKAARIGTTRDEGEGLGTTNITEGIWVLESSRHEIKY